MRISWLWDKILFPFWTNKFAFLINSIYLLCNSHLSSSETSLLFICSWIIFNSSKVLCTISFILLFERYKSLISLSLFSHTFLQKLLNKSLLFSRTFSLILSKDFKQQLFISFLFSSINLFLKYLFLFFSSFTRKSSELIISSIVSKFISTSSLKELAI